MKTATVLFERGAHQWVAIARDPSRPSYVIDTNEYLVSSGAVSLLTDPGGMEIFPGVFNAISAHADPGQVAYLFASHQDPDVISSLALWLEFNPRIKCYLSWLWASFVSHFGGKDDTFIQIPDEGMELRVGALTLQSIPAHYLHSSGNFHLYDAQAKILFTGDVGAALLPADSDRLFVQDFDRHIRHAEGFHRRWMGSQAAKRQWCERVSKLAIEMLCPQHGAIYRATDVQRFINWFDELQVGVVRPPREA